MSDDDRIIRPDQQNIAPPTAARAPVPTATEAGYAQMLGLLREVRAEIQNLRRILMDIKHKAELTDAGTRTREILITLRSNQPLYDRNTAQIGARLGELRSLLRAQPSLYDRYGDEITHIENHWERAAHHWPQVESLPEPAEASAGEEEEAAPDVVLTAEEVVRQAGRAASSLDRLIYHAGLLTIPGRLNQHLEQLRIGQKLDFHATFADEVPDQEARQQILHYLGARPMAIHNGIIDAEKGVVFRASPSPGRRKLSYVLITLAVIAGALLTLLVAEMGEWLDLENWPVSPGQSTDLLVGYAFVIAGGAVHLGVDAIKQARASSGQSFLALEDWFVWIHINEIGVIVGVISMWIGFFGLLFLSGRVDWQTAFLVGYSIDSFVDMFLQRFNTSLTMRGRALAG
jgi:hypothetical protein